PDLIFSPTTIVSSFPFSYPQRIDEFISLSSNQSSSSPDVQHLAFCFLAARKFSVAQALELYHNYQIMLSREGVSQRIDPFDEDVRQELLSGKFVILNDHEVSGARVAQFFVRLHRTNNSNNRSLLQSILFQLDAVLKKEAASRSGLVFIYDMTDAKFANIDCSFGIKLFKLLQFSYPIRLRRILILTAPLWFRASFRVMRGFIRDQLRDCVSVLRPSPGSKLDALSHPDLVTLRHDHHAWLQTALIRTGWLLSDSESSVRPNGHRPQTPAVFFGQTATVNHVAATTAASTASGSISDSSDPENRDDDESACSYSLDEDDVISTGDLDPFALSSSYSSETDGTDADSTHTRPDRRSSADRTDMSASFYSQTKEEAASKRRKGSAMSDISPCGHMDEPPAHSPACLREDHADTPTPPSVVKRLVFPVTFHPDSADLNRPPGTATMTRPATVASSLDNDMGFSENPLPPLIVESTTPTADVKRYPAANLRHAGGDGRGGSGVGGGTACIKSDSINKYRNSAGAESSCSSTTSFFSTGSAGLSSAFSTQSADCSPTGDQLFPRVSAARGGSLSVKQCKLDGTRSVSVMDRNIWSDNNTQIRRIAPLAEDEIGDQTIRHEKQIVNDMMEEDKEFGASCCALNPPTEASLPEWAVGRPHGPSIHQGVIENSKSFPEDPVHTSVHPVDTTDNSLSPERKSASCQLNPVPYADETSLTDEPSLGTTVGFDLSANTTNSTPGEGATVMDDGYNREEDDGDDDLYEISEESDSEQSICLDDYWMTPTEIATHVETLGLAGVQAEYNAVVRVKSEDPRSAFRHVQNREKNRYCDVFCFEDSRVHLRPLSPQITCSSKKIPKVPTSPKSGTLHRTLSAPTAAKDLVQNYIHANWVDGYRQKNAFICTQGPLPETVGDFWQMIWDYRVPIVVMITKIFEADRVKCFPYWPESAQKKLRFACGHPGTIPCQSDTNDSLFDTVALIPDFEVENLGCQVEDHFTCSTLRLTNLQVSLFERM
ncbi:Tyrosine-protein phosphatase non-receptor type 9, partial [Paragonimus heterotremus]